jgi:hypothetical protein
LKAASILSLSSTVETRVSTLTLFDTPTTPMRLPTALVAARRW